MVKVTSKQYYLDGFAEQICQGIADRVQKRKQDILMIIDGREGSGKTNASVCLAYRIADLTGRKFDNEHIFFDLDKMITFAGMSKEQIIVWDESALGGLANNWTSHAQKKLNQMLMVCRKLRHVFIFNIPRFWRLSSAIIERCLCLMHIYEDKAEKPGNFMFIGGEQMEKLYNEFKSTKRANYWKHKKVHGHFTFALPDLIDEDAYEKEKDEAIMKLAQDKPVNKMRQRLGHVLSEMAKRLRAMGFSNKEIAKIMDKHEVTVSNYINS